jgi:pimeloyl-ACP methyl ester carboxylesterase
MACMWFKKYCALLGCLGLFGLAGCSLLEIREQARITSTIGLIKGKIIFSTNVQQKGAIEVRQFFYEDGTYVSRSYAMANSSGEYQFQSQPGTYFIAAYVDANNDGEYQDWEDANYYSVETGQPAAVVLRPGQTVKVPDIVISGELPTLSDTGRHRADIHKFVEDIGQTVTLDDPRFSKSNYSLGIWRPMDFLAKVGGGLYLLQPFEKDKIPVLFIHGINGGPTDWKEVIGHLDRETFQPWVFFYPSGMRLEIIARFLIQAMVVLQRRYTFQQCYIVGHSMGGLVARAFIKDYLRDYPNRSKSIRLLVTVNSPLNGRGSAGIGVRRSPIVVPVWRDIATGSSFLQDLNAWPWPGRIPYHLFFSYLDDRGGDGVVPLRSQIPLKIQAEAKRLYGFNDSHVGILSDRAFIEQFNAVLAAALH